MLSIESGEIELKNGIFSAQVLIFVFVFSYKSFPRKDLHGLRVHYVWYKNFSYYTLLRAARFSKYVSKLQLHKEVLLNAREAQH